jgi:hypothetical protein
MRSHGKALAKSQDLKPCRSSHIGVLRPTKRNKKEVPMASYYVNKNAQNNGDHEVHVRDCKWMPLSENAIYLGEFAHCRDAVAAAKRHFAQVDGCKYCCPACNHG